MIVWKLRSMVYNTHTSQPDDAHLLKDKVVIALTSKMDNTLPSQWRKSNFEIDQNIDVVCENVKFALAP